MGHVAMKHSARYESDATIVLARPVGRHAKDARPKPPPRHALARPVAPPRVRPERVSAADAQVPAAGARPEHATVRFRLPSLAGHQVRPRHLLIGAALLAAGLAGVAGAGAAAHRVDAATPPGPRLAAPSALALPAPLRLSLSATMLPSTGIHSTRPVTTGLPVRHDDPAIANSRAHRVHPGAPMPAWNPAPTLGPDNRWPNGTQPHAGPPVNPPPVDPTLPTAPSEPSSPPPSDPTTPPSDPSSPPSDPTSPPGDPTTPPSTTPTPPSTTPTAPSDSPTDSGSGGPTGTGSDSDTGSGSGSGDSSPASER
jgi:hypothetical protein